MLPEKLKDLETNVLVVRIVEGLLLSVNMN
jgi:hypothetical protein